MEKVPLEVLATSEDGVIEAVRHKKALVMGIMWHPERNRPFEEHDVSLIKKLFENKLQ